MTQPFDSDTDFPGMPVSSSDATTSMGLAGGSNPDLPWGYTVEFNGDTLADATVAIRIMVGAAGAKAETPA